MTTAILAWSGESQEKEVVPPSAFSVDEAGSMPGLRARYQSEGQYVGYTTNRGNLYAICLEWPDGELALTIPGAGEDLKISLVGREGGLSWRRDGDQLLVDVSRIRYNEMPCEHAWVFRIEGVPGT